MTEAAAKKPRTSLPSELEDIVQDLACTYRSTGDASREILVKVILAPGPSGCTATHVGTIRQWFLQRLTSLNHIPHTDDGNGPGTSWKVVYGVHHQWSEANQKVFGEYEEKDGDDYSLVANELVFAVHIDWWSAALWHHAGPPNDKHTLDRLLVVPASTPVCRQGGVDPGLLMRTLQQRPPPSSIPVVAVGVSAVDEATMQHWWAEIVGKERDFMVDREHEDQRAGYMLHPMWVQWCGVTRGENGTSTNSGAWDTVREQSFNFGWDNYPGRRGDDW
jgi:hypothetical protein